MLRRVPTPHKWPVSNAIKVRFPKVWGKIQFPETGQFSYYRSIKELFFLRLRRVPPHKWPVSNAIKVRFSKVWEKKYSSLKQDNFPTTVQLKNCSFCGFVGCPPHKWPVSNSSLLFWVKPCTRFTSTRIALVTQQK